MIQNRIRKSDHRDAVRFETRWAVRPLDILEACNELKPTVIHFSGHGSSSDEIIFKEMMELLKQSAKKQGINEENTPELFVTHDANPDNLFLVAK